MKIMKMMMKMTTTMTMMVGHATCQAGCHQSWHVSGCPSLHDTDSQSRASSSRWRWQWQESPFCKNNSYNLFIDGFPNIKSRSQFQEQLLSSRNLGAFFVHWHNPDIGFGWRQNVVPIPRRGDMAQTRPPRPPCVAMITASIIPELQLFTCAPPPFSREDKPPDKGIQKCQKLQHPFFRNCVTLLQNCIIHHISVKNASFIQHHMRHGLDSWEIAGLDPHSNCGGFDESICRLVSSACVTGANCVCIGFIISNITCRPTLPQWCAI